MSEERRGALTMFLWFLSAIVLAALFIAAGLQGDLTSAHVALAAVLLFLATVGTITVWRMKDSETQPEKAKGRRLDSLLRDLSDDELIELKHRLAAVDSDQESMADYLDDDGEIRQRR
ncbi:MAG: hypothetical protein JNM70_00730 [Anaerolineae bacterium]|nr:hypothetical protein [Anaerolineae bacterium]